MEGTADPVTAGNAHRLTNDPAPAQPGSLKAYLKRKIGFNKSAPRVYLDGRYPEQADFLPGTNYAVDVDETRFTLTLRIADDGAYRVVRKTKHGREVPVIDLNSRDLLDMYQGCDAVRVIIEPGRITIMRLDVDEKIADRAQRREAHLAQGFLTMGSLSHGGGILSNAVHAGLANAGIDARLQFALDMDEAMLTQSATHNSVITSQTIVIAAPMQEAVFDDALMARLPKVDILEMGLPCSGASRSGRSKLNLKMPEEHPEVGHLVASAIALIARINPSLIILENVCEYARSASAWLIRHQLRDMGYRVSERVLAGAEFNVLENRKRWVLVAASRGLNVDLAGIPLPAKVTHTVSEILEPVPADSPLWSPMRGLKAKEVRDKAAGKGFRMQIVQPGDMRIPTITKQYSKRRSTDPKLAHPTNPDLLRQFTAVEHARAKGIPEKLIAGLSETAAHELLGQSIIHPAFAAVAEYIGRTLQVSLTRAGQTAAASLTQAIEVGHTVVHTIMEGVAPERAQPNRRSRQRKKNRPTQISDIQLGLF